MSEETLKSKAIKGMAWNTVEKFAVSGISFLIGIILARLLMPSDYGLVGMLAIFFAFSELFVTSGFSSALIQKKDRTDVDYSTIFYYNLAVAVFFYVLLYVCAPLIAGFYNQPQLIILTRVLSINVIFNSLSLVQQTRLKINLDFKTQAIVSFISVALSGALGIYAAYHDMGVWALVIQSSSLALSRALLLMYFNRWMPMLVFSVESFKQLFGFSFKLLIAGIASTIFNNIYSILIGKVFSPKDTGFYTRARQYPELLSDTITSILQGVTFPILASIQDNRDRLISIFSRVMRVTVFLVIPSLSLFALLSEPFIRYFLTEKWMPVVPLIQWLCFARLFTPISSLNLTILTATGRSDLYLLVDSSKIPLLLVTLLITVPLGLKAIVIGNFITSFLSFLINAYYPGKLFGFGAFRQVREMRLVIYSTLIMAACVFGMMQILNGDLLKLLVCIPVAGITYIGAAYFLKIEELTEVMNVGLSIIGRKKIE
jgi:O-antigen/teichoic acid export membrane protein